MTYTTRVVQDQREGWIGLELYSESNYKKECAASVIFWDAQGQFTIQTFHEVPLVIIEELIVESKQTIKV